MPYLLLIFRCLADCQNNNKIVQYLYFLSFCSWAEVYNWKKKKKQKLDFTVKKQFMSTEWVDAHHKKQKQNMFCVNYQY